MLQVDKLINWNVIIYYQVMFSRRWFECWTLRLLDSSPTVWSFRLRDISPTTWAVRLQIASSFYQQDYQSKIKSDV